MRNVNQTIFNNLKNRATTFVTCWLVTRQDGVQFGFTSHDMEFVFEGVTYLPENGIAAEAIQDKHDFSTNNTTANIVFSQNINDNDVRSGLFDYADVKCFWIDPYHPEQGEIPLLRGFMGEVSVEQNQFKADLRSLLDLLQLPYGHQYNLECDAHLGDTRCGVNMNPPFWAPTTTWNAKLDGDARVGGVVMPSTYNGLWYLCTNGSKHTTLYFPRGTSYAGLGADPFVGTGINPFNSFGPIWGLLIAQIFNSNLSNPSVTPGTPYYTAVTISGGNTGTVEPVWPTQTGATIIDGDLTWTAIPARVQYGTVTGVISHSQFEDGNRTEGTGIYQYGVLNWTGGANVGRTIEVRNYVFGHPSSFTLLEVMQNPIQIGDTYQVAQGCPKIREVCQAKFDNVLNHHGFPDMPTEDRALSSPNFSTNEGLTFSSGGGGAKK